MVKIIAFEDLAAIQTDRCPALIAVVGVMIGRDEIRQPSAQRSCQIFVLQLCAYFTPVMHIFSSYIMRLLSVMIRLMNVSTA